MRFVQDEILERDPEGPRWDVQLSATSGGAWEHAKQQVTLFTNLLLDLFKIETKLNRELKEERNLANVKAHHGVEARARAQVPRTRLSSKSTKS